MKVFLFAVITSMCLLTSCSTVKQIEFNKQNEFVQTSEIEWVKQADLHIYWRQIKPKFVIERNINQAPEQFGVVEVGFLIDQNGNTSEFEILQSIPNNRWHEQALAAAQQLQFIAQQKKQTKRYIYTRWIFTFSST